jgi:hypothetical protein
VHAELPTAELYFPALQAEHTPPFAPEYPALQRQLASSLLTLGACEFDGQFRQAALSIPEY